MTIYEPGSTLKMPHRRWRWISLLLLLALFQAAGVLRMLTLPPDLGEVVSLSPVLEIVTGSLWTLAFAYLARQFWRNSATVQAAVVLLTLFAVYHIGRIALFARADYDRQRLLLLVGLLIPVVTASLIYQRLKK
ncbi:MAG: hypothetical protein H7X77_07530 [Anaerolineae bacterium]|nr:hypothetical protein [Anaerolineae bacterium]